MFLRNIGMYIPIYTVLVIGPKVRGFNPGQKLSAFKDDKNQQHTFLRGGSNSIGTISLHFRAC